MSERYSLSSRVDASRRKVYDKSCDTELRQLAKGSGWTKYQSSLVRRYKEWFVAANLSLWWPTRRVSFDVSVKPMALDSQLWRIMKIEGFEKFALSHRESGAFVCRVPTLATCSIPLQNPQADVRNFIEFADEQYPHVISLLEDTSFTDLVGYINSSLEFGKYTTSYLIALLNDGRYREVLQYEVGQDQTGVTFHNVVLEEDEHRDESVIDLIKAEAFRLSKTRH
ncbi:hypothetical protein [Mesorhizobium australicum]|uniref:hypothetical protein n=1 Tax=Mesorhizobium australicum TaxID=536018 RepID=UPI00111C2604|nr:hypothetical protein [Mesorhizobium australicum]